MKNLISRSITGLILLIITIWVFVYGPDISLFIYFLVIATSAIIELRRALYPKNEGSRSIFLTLASFIGNFFFLYFAWKRNWMGMGGTWLVYALALFIYFLFNPSARMEDLGRTVLVNLYVAACVGPAFFLRHPGFNGLILVLCLSWGSDSFAYLVGLLVGKTPLTKISPNKTVEGSLGGIAGALVLSLIFRPFRYPFLSVFQVIIISILGAIISQLGDLFASRLKRTAEIKDFGRVLGPHGGVMDRYDSVFFVLAFVGLAYSLI